MAPTAPAPESIVAELMIWTYSTAKHFSPAGKKIEELHLDGRDWEVWLDRQWGDVSGANSNKWVYLTYRAKQHSLHTQFNAGKLLAHAVDTGLLSPDHFVADVELGNEIMSGSGVAWVKSFSVDLD